jgi:hypothetical protein
MHARMARVWHSSMKTIELWPRFVLGPYIRKRFGKPGTPIPRYARAPSFHSSWSERPPRPSSRMGARNEVDSNPVPRITTSTARRIPSRVTTASSVKRSIGLVTTSTLGRFRAG